jgi:hypothetical protein
MKAKVNWKKRNALECADLVRHQLHTLNKNDLRHVVRTLIMALDNEDHLGRYLSEGGHDILKVNQMLESQLDDANRKMKAALEGRRTYVMAEYKVISRAIQDLLNDMYAKK